MDVTIHPAPDAGRASFTLPVRVYFEDTDAGGVVYYANYLKFCERARTEWLRTTGVVQNRLATEQNILFVVRSVAADYLRPAVLDDLLEVITTIDKLGRASLGFAQQVRRDGQLLIAAKVIIADGDSTASGYDIVTGFNTAAAATNVLDLVFTTIQANTAGTDGTNVGTGTYAVKSHAITNGVVTFDNVDTFIGAEAVGTGATQMKLADVLSYLATALNGTSATVGFAYDGNGDGDTTDTVDSFFIFQDGAADTVVQLVGVQAANSANVVAVAATAAANTVVIA